MKTNAAEPQRKVKELNGLAKLNKETGGRGLSEGVATIFIFLALPGFTRLDWA